MSRPPESGLAAGAVLALLGVLVFAGVLAGVGLMFGFQAALAWLAGGV